MVNKIFNCNCLDGMKRIADNSIGMILTDLPYNLTACNYDKNIIDLEKFWAEANRILIPTSSAVMFSSGKFTDKLINSNFERYKYKWIWVKNISVNFTHAKNAPLHKFEEILVFSDGVVNHATLSKNRMKYFPQGVNRIEPQKLNRKNKSGQIYTKKGLNKFYVRDSENYPTDVLHFNAPFNGNRLHPSQKPTDLLEYLIKTYTNEGEIVLDATIGSGSTAVAAINTNRNFIGFEIDKNYFEIAQKRIEKALAEKQQRLF